MLLTHEPSLYPASRTEMSIVFYMFLFLIGLFLVYPQFDLLISSYFYSFKNGFDLNQQFIFITHGVHWIAELVIFTVLILMASSFFIKTNRRYTLIIHYIALVLFIGPVLMIDYGLKDHWGRARPDHIINFGGEKHYTMPFLPTNQCAKNCSFVSGHAAAGYSLILLGAITGRRRTWLIRGIMLGFIFGLVRIIQGKHFLSDVLFSFFPVWIAMEIVSRFLISSRFTFVHSKEATS
jgi:lipid A 4'-phosphatase